MLVHPICYLCFGNFASFFFYIFYIDTYYLSLACTNHSCHLSSNLALQNLLIFSLSKYDDSFNYDHAHTACHHAYISIVISPEQF